MILTIESDKSWWSLGTFYDCKVFYLLPCVIRRCDEDFITYWKIQYYKTGLQSLLTTEVIYFYALHWNLTQKPSSLEENNSPTVQSLLTSSYTDIIGLVRKVLMTLNFSTKLFDEVTFISLSMFGTT